MVLHLVRPLPGVGVVVFALLRLGDQEADHGNHQDDGDDDEHRGEGGEAEVVQRQEGDAEDGQNEQQEHPGPERPRQGGLGLTRVLTAVLRLLRSLLHTDGGQLLGGSRVAVLGRQRGDSTTHPRDEPFGVGGATRTCFGHGALS